MTGCRKSEVALYAELNRFDPVGSCKDRRMCGTPAEAYGKSTLVLTCRGWIASYIGAGSGIITGCAFSQIKPGAENRQRKQIRDEQGFNDPGCWSGKPHPGPAYVSSTSPSVLLYHGVPKRGIDDFDLDAAAFERQIALMKERFQFISQNEAVGKRSRTKRIQVLLTFDDGFRNNAEVVAPILKKHHIPATFFVCSRHTVSGRYLWPVHLKMLETKFKKDAFVFRGEHIDMSPGKRGASIEGLKQFLLNLEPHPAEMYRVIEEELPPLEDFLSSDEIDDWCAGMTEEQLAELGNEDLFKIEIHTKDHPFLSRCDHQEQVRQISENKSLIERVCRTECKAISYPSGDYDSSTFELCEDLNLSMGFAVRPSLRSHPNLEIPRMGIYDRSSEILRFKTVFCNQLRRCNIGIG